MRLSKKTIALVIFISALYTCTFSREIKVYIAKLSPCNDLGLVASQLSNPCIDLEYLLPESMRAKLKSEGYISYDLSQPYDFLLKEPSTDTFELLAVKDNYFQMMPREQYITAMQNNGQGHCTPISIKLKFESGRLVIVGKNESQTISFIELLSNYVSNTFQGLEEQKSLLIDDINSVNNLCNSQNMRMLFTCKYGFSSTSRLEVGFVALVKHNQATGEIEVAIIQYDHDFSEYLYEVTS